MVIPREELAGEIEHRQKINRALRERLKQREIQEAHQGFNSPPEVVTDIKELNERIHLNEEEIKKLQIAAAEDVLSFAEVEYQVLLAYELQASQTQLSIAGRLSLELARLRLGILPEQAVALENTIRADMSKETFHKISPEEFTHSKIQAAVLKQSEYSLHNLKGPSLDLLKRAIQLDPMTTATLFLAALPQHTPISYTSAESAFKLEQTFWRGTDEYNSLEIFLQKLKSANTNV